MGRVSFLHAAADARNTTVIASQCSHWRGEESRAPPVADEARRTSGSGQNFGGFNTAAKLGAPQQEIRFWPPCVKGAVSYGGIAAEIGAKNMPPACFLNAPTGGLSVIRQPLRQKSKIFATSPYTGEALVTDSHVASLLGMTLAGVALSLAYPSSSPVISATSGSMKKPSRMPRFSAMSAFFRRVWASSNST